MPISKFENFKFKKTSISKFENLQKRRFQNSKIYNNVDFEIRKFTKNVDFKNRKNLQLYIPHQRILAPSQTKWSTVS